LDGANISLLTVFLLILGIFLGITMLFEFTPIIVALLGNSIVFSYISLFSARSMGLIYKEKNIQ
jgi:hypothetical protein